jgi:two-component system chemotaxis response regulator CheY
MVNVLFCDLQNNLSTIRDTFTAGESVVITDVTSCTDAVEKSKITLFDIIVIDIAEPDLAFASAVGKLREYNLSSLIIAVGDIEDEASRDLQYLLLKRGVSDYVNQHISKDLMKVRLHNYLDIIRLKKGMLYNRSAVNLFDNKVYNRTLVFGLGSKKSLVEFWDYFIQYHHYDHPQLDNATQVLYGLAGWLYRNHEESAIYLEESTQALYLTLMPVDIIRDSVIEDVIAKYAGELTHKHAQNRLSIVLELEGAADEAEETIGGDIAEKPVEETLEIDDEKKKILGKTHFNKTPAYEFVESTAISLMDKIDALEDVENRMDEVLIAFEDAPSVTLLKEVSNAFISYAEVVELMVEFDHLVFAIKTLAEGVSNVTEEQFDAKSVKKFVTLCLNLVHDLSAWRDNIFIKQEANDVHYLDSSLLSSCLQIEAIFAQKEIEEEEDDFELF